MRKIILMLVLVLSLVACSAKSGAEEASETKPSAEDWEDEEDFKEGGEIKVSAAASLQDALNEISDMYKKEKKIGFQLNYGSSGALQSQIEEGAQIDIFISASKKQMDTLVKEGFVEKEDCFDLLDNEMVLVTSKENPANIHSIKELGEEKVGLVALGDPASVPAGQYAQEILDYYQISDAVKEKTNYGSDVRQVLNWAAMGEVDAGFVYRTDAILEKDKLLIVQTAPEDSHKKISYPAGILKESENKDLARDFLTYIKSDAAMEIFEKYGFGRAD